MGEQTQTQPQPQPQSPPKLSSKTPPNSSKIPLRPHKLRKLSLSPLPTPKQEPHPQIQPKPTNSLTLTNPSSVKSRRKTLPPPSLKPLSFPGEISAGIRHLHAVDHLLSDLIPSLPPPTYDTHQPPFLALTKSILYQQLAFKAGTQIYTKFVELCGGESLVLPDTVLSLSPQSLKAINVSVRKTTYLFDLAHKFKTGILSDETIMKMDEKSLFTMLSMVKGIGSWSVHMFMIFSLHRPDVLPVSDIGVRKGVQLLYGLEELPRPSQIEQLCEKWKPFRSVGSWYMWRLVEAKGAAQGGAVVAYEGISVMPLQQQMVQQHVDAEEHQRHVETRQHVEAETCLEVEEEAIDGDDNFGDCIWEQ